MQQASCLTGAAERARESGTEVFVLQGVVWFLRQRAVVKACQALRREPARLAGRGLFGPGWRLAEQRQGAPSRDFDCTCGSALRPFQAARSLPSFLCMGLFLSLSSTPTSIYPITSPTRSPNPRRELRHLIPSRQDPAQHSPSTPRNGLTELPDACVFIGDRPDNQDRWRPWFTELVPGCIFLLLCLPQLPPTFAWPQSLAAARYIDVSFNARRSRLEDFSPM